MSNVYTRLTNQRTVFEMVARTYPQAVRTIKTVPEIYAFVQVAEVFVDAAEAVHTLTLVVDPSELADGATRQRYIPCLRNSLRACPNLTDLTLLLPRKTLDAIFFQIAFPALRLFKTNLPHQVIKGFVTRHETLTDLVIGPCGITGPSCPLADIDFGQLTTLECTAACVRSVVRPGLVYLSVENKSASCYMSSVIRTLPVVMAGLRTLSLDIFPDDMEILHSILRVAPTVRKLKLVEKQASVRSTLVRRRAFKDYLTWHRGLRKLVYLEEFALRTSADLVSCPGDYDKEHRLIAGWACGVRTRRSTFAVTKMHPSLYHIMIWYGAHTNNSVLTKWYKDSADWYRLDHPTLGAQLQDIDF